MIETDLTNKVAAITGSGSGIGEGTAKTLAEAGCKVVLVGQTREKLQRVYAELKETGAEAEIFKADVSNEVDIKGLADFIKEKFGRLDILCNIAGITVKKPIFDLEAEEWDRVINVNLRGVFLCCKYLGKLIEESRDGTEDFGKVINIASVGSFQGIPLSSAYCASKGGVHTLTKVLSTEWAMHRITVNAIVPGYIETPLSSGVLSNPDAFKKVTSSIPMNKLGNVKDIGNAIHFLVSQSSNYISGADLMVDGGFISAAYTVEN